MEKTIELLEYTNPRTSAVIEGWPWGQKLRTTARFFIEANKYGERAGRILVDPRSGRDCAPKFTTYAKAARIVDGSDGRTYIATLGQFNFSLQIVCGDMKYTREYPPAGGAGTPEHERHAQILALFSAEATPTDPPKGGEVAGLERDLGDMRAITDDSEPLAQANAEGRDITLGEGLDFLRGAGVQVVVLDDPDTVAEKLSAAFGAPAAQGEPIKGTSGEGGAA